jgi:hypothetical protein
MDRIQKQPRDEPRTRKPAPSGERAAKRPPAGEPDGTLIPDSLPVEKRIERENDLA